MSWKHRQVPNVHEILSQVRCFKNRFLVYTALLKPMGNSIRYEAAHERFSMHRISRIPNQFGTNDNIDGYLLRLVLLILSY